MPKDSCVIYNELINVYRSKTRILKAVQTDIVLSQLI